MDKSIVTKEESKAETGLQARIDTEDPETQRELIEDLAAANQALEEYEAQGIDGTTSYTEYRAKRLGTKA